MRNRNISLLFLFILFIIPFFSPVQAQRIAECDACGYCNGRTPPENWASCAECLYPVEYGINHNPTSNLTLKINEDPTADNFNKPPAPAAGKYYTQLGCLNTGLSSFTNISAGGGVLNFLLNYLIFPIVGVLAFMTIIYGAFLLLTAQGDQFKIAQGKRLITSAVVGLIFTFSVVLIINLIGANILRIPGMQQDEASQDFEKIKLAIEKLSNDTGELPNHLDPNICVHNPEVFIDSPRAGLIATDGSFTGWNGPYLTDADVTDQYGTAYYLDSDYRCRPDVKGCETVNFEYNQYDKITEGRSKFVRAIVSFGQDRAANYCNITTQYICRDNNRRCQPLNSNTCRDDSNVTYSCSNIEYTGCTRTDEDNTVLVLCGW